MDRPIELGWWVGETDEKVDLLRDEWMGINGWFIGWSIYLMDGRVDD